MITDDRSVEALSALCVATDDPHRWAAFVALGLHDDPAAAQVLTGFASDPDPYVRRISIEALGRRPRAEAARAVIVAALTDRSAIVVRTACEVCAALELREAGLPLARLLATEPETCLSALLALEVLWQPDLLETVLALYDQTASRKVRRQAASTLRAHVDARAWRRLFARWSVDSLPRHRVWACEIAGSFGDASVVGALADLARDSSGQVRKAAERARKSREA